MNMRGIGIAILCGSLLAAVAAFSAQVAGGGDAQAGIDSDPHHATAQGGDAWDNDAFFYSIFREPTFKHHGPGFREGFRAGYEDGRKDIEDGAESHFGYRFRYPDQYRIELGNRDDYIREYQDGYKAGYQRGYAEPV